MSTIEQPVEVDGEKLMQFVFRAVDEVGATLNAALVVMGDKLGWYRALAGTGGLSPAELAERTGAAERYVREWLNAQAAGGYVDYDPDSGLYSLPPEQTVALTDPTSPAYLPGFFQIALGSVLDSPRISEIARSGDGHGLARARARRSRGLRAVLPSRIQRPPGRGMAAGARRRRRKARARRAGGRRRLRARRLDDPDGAGVPELDVRGIRLPRRVDRDRAPAGAGGRRRGPGQLPRRAGSRVHRGRATTS